MILSIRRDQFAPDFTLGMFLIDGVYFGEICEDTDRKLEAGGEKQYGRTAIPRGRYKIVLSRSQRFGKIMPEVLSVPGFSGVRIHGGNHAADTLGCPLLGAIRTANGVRDCAAINQELINKIASCENRGEAVFLEIS
jgi:hypothetical protein